MSRKIESRIEINASQEVVWGILNNLDAYPDWNPFTPRVETDLSVGSEVILHVSMALNGKTMTQKERMLRFEPMNEMAWGIPSGLIRTDRTQQLRELEDGIIEYYTCDEFWGPLVPLVFLLYAKRIQRGFDATAMALKLRAETTV